MEALGILLTLALAVVACVMIGTALVWGAAIGWVLVMAGWPMILGIVIGTLLIINVDANLGVVVIAAGIGGNFIWANMSSRPTSKSDPMSNKIHHYDVKGNVKGYSDRPDD